MKAAAPAGRRHTLYYFNKHGFFVLYRGGFDYGTDRFRDPALLAYNLAHVVGIYAKLDYDGLGPVNLAHVNSVGLVHEGACDKPDERRYLHYGAPLQKPALLQKPAHRIGGLCAGREPVLCPVLVELDYGGIAHGILIADFLYETAVTGRAAVGYYHAIEGLLLHAHSLKTNLDH